MANDVKDSYVGLNHGEVRQLWLASPAVRGSDYTQLELERIDRKWRSLGKRIANGARIPDGPLFTGNKRKTS